MSTMDVRSEMTEALSRMDTDKVKRLIENGADPRMKIGGYHNSTPFLTACEEGDWITVTMLAKTDAVLDTADLENTDYAKCTALHLAVFSTKSFGILSPGLSLHRTTHQNFLKVVKILISMGVNVNPENDYGNTPLHIAVEHACPAIVQALLDNGADLITEYKSPIGAFTVGRLAIVLERPEMAALIGAEAQRRVIVAEEAMRMAKVAFAMGKHERLGEESLVLSLHPEMVKMILDFV
jgi:ankyrin repeat protein